MHLEHAIALLDANANRIAGLVRGVENEVARRRPSVDDWSILEVINHLYDEEREDFRARIEAILSRPDELPAAIDPVGWVTERRYNERDLATSLDNFLGERQQSLAWLRGLGEVNWQQPLNHPTIKLRAGDLLAAWVAHDVLHMRQLVELHYAIVSAAAGEYSMEYAGEWT
jgi:uncharacterized damage-inducible protein DinB